MLPLSPAFQKKFKYEAESLEGKRVLITGGTTGIGRSTALLLAAYGASVVIFGRHEQELLDTLADFQELGLHANVHGFTADVSTKEGIQKIFEETDRRFDGHLDILIRGVRRIKVMKKLD